VYNFNRFFGVVPFGEWAKKQVVSLGCRRVDEYGSTLPEVDAKAGI
jgi:hypothetical protein